MVTINTWWTIIKDGLKDHPLMANMFVSLTLAALENITDMKFACPCDRKYNLCFTLAFIVATTILVCPLMIITRDWSDSSLLWKNIRISLIPAVVWLILVFMDGQYYACAWSSWNGTFAILDKDEQIPSKWCDPGNTTLTQEYKTQTLQWFSVSQAIRLMFAFVLAGLAMSISSNAEKPRGKTEENKKKDQAKDKDPDTSPLNPDTAGSKGGAIDRIELQQK